jgi:hypothetical protein
VIHRAAHATEAKMRCNLPQTGCHAGGLLAFLNEIQDLLLFFGQPVHTVQMNGIFGVMSTASHMELIFFK